MVDFPAGVPDFPGLVPGNSLATAHGGAVSLPAGMNRALLNARTLATKLGPGAGAPSLGQLLAGAVTAGQTSYAGRTGGTTLLVAASNASAATRSLTPYVCDGTADEVEINAALAALPASGGSIRFSEGTFTLAAPVITVKANSHLVGSGMGATILRVVDAGGAPVNDAMVQLPHASCSLSSLTVDGNKANNAAQGNMVMIRANGADVLVDTVRVTNAPAYGFVTANVGVNVRYVNCLADGVANQGFLVRTTGEAGRALVLHCIARTCGSGFLVDDGPVTLIGCSAISNTAHGIQASAQSSRLIGCEAYGNVNLGFYLTASWISVIDCRAYLNGFSGLQITGTDGLIAGLHAIQNGRHGIQVSAQRAQVVGCRVIDNSTSSNLGYSGIYLASGTTDSFVDGNMVRQGSASANKQVQAISLVSGSTTNVMLGHNDIHDGSAGGTPISDQGINTRRMVKQQLNYVAASPVLDTSPVVANTWTNIGTAQTFRVDSPTSLVTIALHGHLMYTSASNVEVVSRLLVDGATAYRLGGGMYMAVEQYINPFAGGNMVIIDGLPIGNHTVIAQFAADVATGTAYLRVGDYEPYGIQVLEHFR